jgi:hypothetical protein
MSEPGRKFTIGPCLGRGGFGEVYRGTMRSPGGLETAVAVKVLRADVDSAGDAVQRLRDEGRLLARLDHPVILRVHDLVMLDGRVALVTELVEGADLDECAAPPDPIPPRAALQAIAAVAGALDVAFRTPGPDGRPIGLVHRDLKPGNVRIGKHGEPKLLDFGVARSEMADREARTDSDLVVGSLAYMAPERFVERDARAPSDVFGLGAVLYEALAGERFHVRPSLRDVSTVSADATAWEAHVAERFRRLAHLPEPLPQLLAGMLAWDAEQRPSAAEVAQRGEQIADTMAGPTLRAWCRSHAWPAARKFEGPLEGRVLTEGALPFGEAPAGPPQIARVVRGPVVTIDDSASDAPPPPAAMPGPRPLGEVRPNAPLPTPKPPPLRVTPIPRASAASIDDRAYTEEGARRVPAMTASASSPAAGRGRALVLLVVVGVVAMTLAALGLLVLAGAGIAVWSL